MDGAFVNKADLPVPRVSAPYEERARWARQYGGHVVREFGARLPPVELPPDVRPTHLYEIEFQSAVMNPAEYFRQTALWTQGLMLEHG